MRNGLICKFAMKEIVEGIYPKRFADSNVNLKPINIGGN